MKRWVIVVMFAMLSTACAGVNANIEEPASPEDTAIIETSPSMEEAELDMTESVNKLSYAAGYKIGDMFQNLKLKIISEAVLLGITDARTNVRPKLTKAEMKIALQDPKGFLIAGFDSLAEKQKKEETLFLNANAKREGVVALDSGLQYSVMQEGNGKTPNSSDVVNVSYIGRSLKGHVFDNTYDRGAPEELPVGGVMPGMTEALQLMQEGDKWEVYIPIALAFGGKGPMSGQMLIYELELLEVLSK
jgi:FKBP-type peptidyl-prolyl cis-trans isomerase FklB